MTPVDQVYEIHSHLLYEAKWMIFAASELELAPTCGHYVALIDSAIVHARNLLEFCELRDTEHFTLADLGGAPQPRQKDWHHFVNNRVAHMYLREHSRPAWPCGLTNDSADRLMVMAETVVGVLEAGGVTIPGGPVHDGFLAVVSAARSYVDDPCEANHLALADLYDGSRDGRPY